MTASSIPPRRQSAAERREHLLDVAMHEFAERGFEGGSTERIAQAAGISQPYVFRLFGSKLQLFIAVLEHCFEETRSVFEEAASGLDGEAALDAIGEAYMDLIQTRPALLQCQLAAYASCNEDAVREAVRHGYGRLVTLVERSSSASADRIAVFFAKGMLLNVTTAMGLPDSGLGWGTRLIDGCWYKPAAKRDA